MKALEAAGVIRGYRAVVDRKAVGCGLTVFVEFFVNPHSRENASELEELLLEIPEVVACSMVAGEADFLAEIAVADIEAYEAILSDRLLVLPYVRSIRSNFSLRSIKDAGAIPVHSAPTGRASRPGGAKPR